MPALVCGGLAAVIAARYLYYFATGGGGGHVQSLLLGAVLVLLAFLLAIVGFLAELQAVNRTLLEDIQWRMRKLDVDAAARDGGA